MFGGDEASGSSWGMQRAGGGCPGFRVRADPPMGLQDRPRSPWQPRGLTGGDYETGVTRLSVATPLLEATSGDVKGGFREERRRKGRPKSTVCSKGVALSICPLNHPLSAATPMWSPGHAATSLFLLFCLLIGQR